LSRENAVEKLERLVVAGQEEDAEEVAREILDAGVDPMQVMESELFPTMKNVGEKFEKGEFFLTDLMSGADAMRAASRVLTSRIKEEGKIAEAPVGKTFQECYDVKKIAPRKEYTELYRSVKRELLDIGVPFAY